MVVIILGDSGVPVQSRVVEDGATEIAHVPTPHPRRVETTVPHWDQMLKAKFATITTAQV